MDDTLRYSRRLSFVPRWVVMPTIRKQSVAEHSYHVAQTVRWLMQFAPVPLQTHEKEFVLAALDHDTDEAVSGDTPSPNKAQASPEMAPMSKVFVKVADLLEAVAFVHEEMLLGNRYGMDQVLGNLMAKLHDWWNVFPWDADRLGQRKPLTFDLTRRYLEQTTPKVHPVMENMC